MVDWGFGQTNPFSIRIPCISLGGTNSYIDWCITNRDVPETTVITTETTNAYPLLKVLMKTDIFGWPLISLHVLCKRSSLIRQA